MAHTIKLGNFKKHENSTAQPNAESWAEFSITYKGGADLDNPTVTISADYTIIEKFNYAVLDNKYYFIRSRNMLRSGVSVLVLALDPMATYKKEIGAASLYVVRSAAAYNGYIKDNYYPQTSEKTVAGVAFENAPVTGFAGGYFVINVAGKTIGSSTLYSVTPANFAKLIGQLMGTVDSAGQGLSNDWLGVIEAISNSIFEPMRYINSVMWFPVLFDGQNYNGLTDPMYIGKWQSGIDYRIISNPIAMLHDEAITLPKHPQAADRGEYLNLAPYSYYNIEYDPFGSFSIDTSQLISETQIRATVYADALTGQGILKVRGENNTANLASITTQLGVQLPITAAGIGAGTVSSVASVVGGLGSLFTGNLAGTAGTIGSGIDSAISAITGSVSSLGSQGAVLSYATPKGLTGTFYEIIDEDLAHNGRPLCEIRQISTLPGYNKVQYGDVEIPGTIVTQQTIRRYLETGFYYE